MGVQVPKACVEAEMWGGGVHFGIWEWEMQIWFYTGNVRAGAHVIA